VRTRRRQVAPEMVARRAVALALCAVARAALDACERAGAVDDDRPELALATLERWCRGEATRADVRRARAGLAAWRAASRWAPGPPADPLACVRGALWAAADFAARNLWSQERRSGACTGATRCLLAFEADEDAALARASNVYAAALADAERELEIVRTA
jgi:hypothetical protein